MEKLNWISWNGLSATTNQGRVLYRLTTSCNWIATTKEKTVSRILNEKEADETERAIERWKQFKRGE